MATQWKTTYAATEVETVNCPLCGAQSYTQLTQEWTLGIVQCSKCELIYINPRLREPEKNYWTTREKFLQKYGAILEGLETHNRDRNYREHLKVISEFQPTGRFLDIGTHCGFFLRLARHQSWELFGIEPSPHAAALAREKFDLQVHTGYLEQETFPENFFDVITMTDVLEHVSEPLELLETAYKILKPGGILFVKVPNATWNLLKYRILKQWLNLKKFDVFNAREHVIHYTSSTLIRMLEEAGFVKQKLYVPLPIQEGKWWQKGARSIAYSIAQINLGRARRINAFAADLACVAKKFENLFIFFQHFHKIA